MQARRCAALGLARGLLLRLAVASLDESRGPGSVLVVGDDPQSVDPLLAAARAAGYLCEHCTDRQHARARILSGSCAAAIVDLERRDGDGVPLLATVRRFGPELWIVALLPPAIVPTPTMGYDVAVAKPAAPQTVIQALARMPS